jgi:hypothetical protein
LRQLLRGYVAGPVPVGRQPAAITANRSPAPAEHLQRGSANRRSISTMSVAVATLRGCPVVAWPH